MINPLLSTSEELDAQSDEIRFGIYELAAFKKRYINVNALLHSAATKLEAPSKDRSKIATIGVTKAAIAFRTRRRSREAHSLLRASESKSSEFVDEDGDEDDEIRSPQRWYSALSNADLENHDDEHTPRSSPINGLHTPESFGTDFLNEIKRVEEICSSSIDQYHTMIEHVAEAIRTAPTPINTINSNSFRIQIKNIFQKLHQIAQFASANHTMAARILHSKVVSDSRFGPKVRSDLMTVTEHVFQQKEKIIYDQLTIVENLFAENFGVGNADTARFELLAYISSKPNELGSVMSATLGFVLSSVLFTLGFIFYSPSDIRALEQENLYYPFRGLTVLATIPWFHLIAIIVFRKAMVNYVLLFNMDTKIRKYHSVENIAFRACVTTILLLTSLLSCLLLLRMGHPRLASACPAVAFPIYLFGILSSVPAHSALNSPVKENLLSLIGLGTLSFGVVFITDIMTSLARPMGDLARLVCHIAFYDEWGRGPAENRTCATSPALSKIVIPVLAAYPLGVRLLQEAHRTYSQRSAWPGFFSGVKYAFAIEVVVLSSIRMDYLPGDVFFQFVFVTSSLIAYFWDIYIDFGLGIPRYRALREKLMYPYKSFYYFAIVADFFLRFAWTLTLVSPEYLMRPSFPILIPLGRNFPSFLVEIFRRFMWVLLRVENEHLKNTLHYREVDFVPLYFATEAENEDDEHEAKEGPVKKWALVVVSLIRVAILLGTLVLVVSWSINTYR